MTVTKIPLSYSPTSLGISAVVLLIGLLTLLVPSNVLAVPKGPGGQSCKSTGTTSVNGTQDGKAVKCTADYCKYDECETSGPNIGKCYEKTHYSNVRNCKAAARNQLPQNKITPKQMAPQMQGQTKQPRRYAPRFQGGAIMRRGIESEQPVELSPDETTTITLDQAVHFVGTDGSDVIANPGEYSVEAAQEWLRLIPGAERRDALLIEAQPGTHDVKVEIPIVISTPGTEPDELDVHIVQFLNPDGTSLVATGTYSGIQSRGLGDAARQAAARARARAEGARKAAAAQAQQTADAARSAALKAKQAAEQVTQAISSTLLTATNKLRADLIPLIQCLDAAKDQSRANLLGYVDQFQKNPGGFSQWMIQDQMDQMRANFSHTMGPALQMLRNGMNQPPQAGLIIDMAFDSWEQLAATHPGARCLTPLITKHRPALKNTAHQLQSRLQTEMKSLFDTHIAPALHEAIGKGLGKILTGKDSGVLLSEEELQAVANGVFAKYLIRQLQNGSTAIQSFTKALGNPGAQSAAVTQIQQALHPQAQWPELFRLELGVEIVRAMGHKYIDSDRPGHGGFLVNEAMGLIQLSEGTVEKVSSALCGLVPEAGAAVCAVVEEAMDAVWNQALVPLIRWGATTGLHAGYNQAMDQGKLALQQGKLPRDMRAQTPHLQGILNILSKDLLLHLADTNLKDTRDALNLFNGSVTQLATAVNGR